MKKWLLLVLLTQTKLLISSESSHTSTLYQEGLIAKILGRIGTSCPPLIKKYVADNVENSEKITQLAYANNQQASEKYTAYLQEAYEQLRTPAEQQILALLSSQECPERVTDSACTTAGFFVINEQELNKKNIGTQRYFVFREAVHNHFNDATLKHILSKSYFITIPLAHKLLGHIFSDSYLGQASRAVTALLIGSATSCILNLEMDSFTERRAQIQGLRATHCSQCTVQFLASTFLQKIPPEKFLSRTSSLEDTLAMRANLSLIQKLTPIADELQKQNLVCKYHQ